MLAHPVAAPESVANESWLSSRTPIAVMGLTVCASAHALRQLDVHVGRDGGVDLEVLVGTDGGQCAQVLREVDAHLAERAEAGHLRRVLGVAALALALLLEVEQRVLVAARRLLERTLL